MRYYMVLEWARPGHRPQVRLLRDGFSWWALACGPLWLAWHRSWRIFVAILIALIAIAVLSKELLAWASLAVSIIIGFEGTAWAAEAMQRRGWRMLGIIAAPNIDAAELRLAQGHLIAEESEQATTHLQDTASTLAEGGGVA